MKTVQIEIPEELESQLRTLAGDRGLSLQALLVEFARRETSAGDSANAVSRSDPLAAEIHRLQSRSEAEIEAVLARSIRKPIRPLPPGETLSDVIEGKWPGTETDQEIAEALERLS